MKAGSPHHLLFYLKEQDDVPQAELDGALHEAAWLGYASCVQILLAAGADLYSVSSEGNVLLAEAVFGRNPDVLRVLLESGYTADLDAPDTLDRVLHIAISITENVDMTRMLLKVNVTFKCTLCEGRKKIWTYYICMSNYASILL